MNYLINNIYPCIQGEGALTGIPMIMLRLHGCEVGCPWCDTKETWEADLKYQKDSFTDILGANPNYTEKVQSEIVYYLRTNFHPGINWALVSGGEPARFYLKPLVTALHDTHYKVALETSGTELGHIDANFDWVCVSPKINMPGGKRVIPEALEIADEIKYVIGKQADVKMLQDLLTSVKLKQDCQICLQPVSQSPKATKLCIQTVQEQGWRLSIQLHKYLNLP